MTYCFDQFTLEPSTRRLLRDDQEIRLSPKAFDLLLLLVEGRSRAMAKSDLHGKLWPATYVADTNLASLVAELRRALSDPAQAPRYIRTMHRFGYWFIADVSERDDPVDPIRKRIRYWLIWETRQIPLDDGENIVGRAPDASVWIDAAGVSRQHARILVDGPSVTIEDLDSKNGTYLGARRLSAPAVLADGDQIRVGPVVITFRIPPPAQSTDSVADD